MRYFLSKDTLFLRGEFSAASTGDGGGVRAVSTVICHTIDPGFLGDRSRELALTAAAEGLSGPYFGLLTHVPLERLCVMQNDFITVFIIAGLPDRAGEGVAMIVYSGQGLGEGALLEAILTAATAKSEALRDLGARTLGDPADAVCIVSEGEPVHCRADLSTPAGERIAAAVRRGVPEAVARARGEVLRTRASFFVFSRFGEAHWVEWQPESCRYYPCHFTGQSCAYCYCPLYPCRDEALGQWVESSSGGKIWNCSRCTLLHEQRTAEYLSRNPEASLAEIKRFSKNR
jgi:adenosylcobinamide hydrolase